MWTYIKNEHVKGSSFYEGYKCTLQIVIDIHLICGCHSFRKILSPLLKVLCMTKIIELCRDMYAHLHTKCWSVGLLNLCWLCKAKSRPASFCKTIITTWTLPVSLVLPLSPLTHTTTRNVVYCNMPWNMQKPTFTCSQNLLKYFCSRTNCIKVIVTKFCTCHDSHFQIFFFIWMIRNWIIA